MEIYKDPVIMLQDGQTYERSYITKWMNEKHTSPITREQISKPTYLPNLQIKSILEETRAELILDQSKLKSKLTDLREKYSGIAEMLDLIVVAEKRVEKCMANSLS